MEYQVLCTVHSVAAGQSVHETARFVRSREAWSLRAS